MTARNAQHSLVLATTASPTRLRLKSPSAERARSHSLLWNGGSPSPGSWPGGGTPWLISKRLHANGTTALMLTARCQDVTSGPSKLAKWWRPDERGQAQERKALRDGSTASAQPV